jgi:hypothetical protein
MHASRRITYDGHGEDARIAMTAVVASDCGILLEVSSRPIYRREPFDRETLVSEFHMG